MITLTIFLLIIVIDSALRLESAKRSRSNGIIE